MPREMSQQTLAAHLHSSPSNKDYRTSQSSLINPFMTDLMDVALPMNTHFISSCKNQLFYH